MKFLGNDKTGAPQFEWCCSTAKEATDAISYLNDGNREYDNDKTGFYMVGACKGSGKHNIHKIFFCPFCGAPVEK